ncbi:MAG: hypothetical protein WCF90_03555 [Methanomicrobiales archaeon]
MNLGYIVYGIDWKPRWVYRVHTNRFTIESSYLFRYLLTIISFLFKNIWVALRWVFFFKVKQGPRTIDNDLFRFDLFRLFVREGLRKKLKFVAFVSVLRSLD